MENYDNNVDGQKTLLLKASDNKDFFSGMTDEMVIAYADVCRKMNDRFDLNVKKVYPIERLAADKKGFWETVWGALQGEFNEDQTGSEILIDMGLNFIPFVGQACDARDIAACLKKLVLDKRVNEAAIWVTLFLTAIGCVPYAGDVVKAGCKAILKGADDIFIAVLKKIDAENVYRAFGKFRSKFASSIDKAIEMVCKWIEEARKSKYGSKMDSIAARAGENLRKATEFMKKQIDEFGERVFRKKSVPIIKKVNTVQIFDSIMDTTGKIDYNKLDGTLNALKHDIQKGMFSADEICEISNKIVELKIVDEYEAVMKNVDFRKYLINIAGVPPEYMIRPHAHHILFKTGLGKKQQELVKEGQAILRKYGIDPIISKENLIWAPNAVEGQHTIEVLEQIVKKLREIDSFNLSKDMKYNQFVKWLQYFGNKASNICK